MYFDFEDLRPDTPRLPRTLTSLEQVLLTLLLYAGILIVMLAWPHLAFVKAMQLRQQQALDERQRRDAEDLRNRAQFVFVKTRDEMKAKAPPRIEALSDKDRRAMSMERAPQPKNDVAYSRGNSPERVVSDAKRPNDRPADEPKPDPRGNNGDSATPAPNPNSLSLPNTAESTIARNDPSKSPLARGSTTGILSDAIRNVQRYSQGESLQNVQGSGELGPSIQFDTKGIDFGPWLNRFIAQIRRNWFVPYAAMSLHGHVVLQFNVHKDGRITDLEILEPSAIDAFTKSAANAIKLSNPTMPFPPEYPDEKGLFRVIFYINEMPPGGGSK